MKNEAAGFAQNPPQKKTNPKPNEAGSDLKGRAAGEKKREKPNPKPAGFGFERRRKEANAVFGNSLWLLPETELSGLCADVVPVTGFEPVHPRGYGILSPRCLPVPPHRHFLYVITATAAVSSDIGYCDWEKL